MADKKGEQLDRIIDAIKSSKNSLYSDIYYNHHSPNQQMKAIKSKLDKSLQAISNNNVSFTGVDNISALYAKTLDKQERDQRDLINNINTVLSNKSLMDNVMAVYNQNTMVRDLDKEIDMVRKYMPKLDDALETRKEHVLSADHFNKDPIMIKSNTDSEEQDAIDNNIETMETKYNLSELLDQIYDETDVRGECFVYIVPYKKALDIMLRDYELNGGYHNLGRPTQEAVEAMCEKGNIELDTEDIFTEAAEEFEDLSAKYKLQHEQKQLEEALIEEASNIKFTFNKSGVIASAVRDYYKADSFLNETGSLFFTEAEKHNQDPGMIGNAISSKAKTVSTKGADYNTMSQDGVMLVDGNGKPTNGSSKIKVPGCVVKILDHTMVKPLYIDQMCLGYFYIECEHQISMEQTTFSSTVGGIRPGGFNKSTPDPYGNYGNEYVVLKSIASKISEKIDAKFINANQDLTKEIYAILKYNATVDATGKIAGVNITFIPPEDMEHCFFDFDRKTKRGISALYKSLFPAKLFSCMYISNVIQNLTRGNDRRVFYVKQSIDTNIAGVIGNVINQIQRSNFGIRQIESMSNVLNMLGRFNDFIIPRSPSGDAPIDFEVIPGQQTDIKTEMMNMLEEMAVNATEVPLEVIQMRQQVDYATHLTMTNTKFLQKVYNRQGKAQRIFSRIITKIYNYEYHSDDNNPQTLHVILPPPIYLNAINGTQVLDAVGGISNTLGEMRVSAAEENEHPGLREEVARQIKCRMADNILPKEIVDKSIEEAYLSIGKNATNQNN